LSSSSQFSSHFISYGNGTVFCLLGGSRAMHTQAERMREKVVALRYLHIAPFSCFWPSDVISNLLPSLFWESANNYWSYVYYRDFHVCRSRRYGTKRLSRFSASIDRLSLQTMAGRRTVHYLPNFHFSSERERRQEHEALLFDFFNSFLDPSEQPLLQYLWGRRTNRCQATLSTILLVLITTTTSSLATIGYGR